MPSVFMLSVVMLRVIMMSVIMLSVSAIECSITSKFKHHSSHKYEWNNTF